MNHHEYYCIMDITIAYSSEISIKKTLPDANGEKKAIYSQNYSIAVAFRNIEEGGGFSGRVKIYETTMMWVHEISKAGIPTSNLRAADN